MGKSGGGGGGNTTTVQKSDPWSGVQPYLIGGGGTFDPMTGQMTGGSRGIFPEAQNLHQNQSWSPGMQSINDAQRAAVSGRQGWEESLYGLKDQINRGDFDSDYQRVGGISGAPTVTAAQIAGADRIRAQNVDPTAAFQSLGLANPANSLGQMLSGQVNTSALDPVVSNAMRRMGENFNEQVMPGIRSGAILAGGYGGSRQGVAEGLAAKGLLQSMGDMSSNMYNNAFNTAQSNMYGTSNNMAGLGLSNAQGNAGRDLSAQTTNASNQLAQQQFNANMLQQANLFNAGNAFDQQKFNANLGLQNNTQGAANAAQMLGNRQAAANLLQSGIQMQDQNLQQQMGLLQQPNDYNWNNLNRYASIVQPGSGIGSQSTSSANQSVSPLSGLAGGAAMGAGLGSMMGAGAGLSGTAALGAFAPWMLGGAVLGGLLR